MATYQIDSAHSVAAFSIRHMMIANVRGEFTKLTGTINYDPAKPTATTIEGSIDVHTINTREADRDTHLKSPDFFDAEKYPQLTFKSKSVSGSGTDWKVKGDMTIHGVTKEVTFDVEGPTSEAKDPWGNMRIGATATTKVNRKDFGLHWNAALEMGGVLVGDDVKITIDLEAIRQ